MKTTLNFIRLILLAAWLGATLFFGAVVAPSTFAVLRAFELTSANEMAGSIVKRCLSAVNITGFIIGLFLLVTVFVGTRLGGWKFFLELLSEIIIILATGIGHWVIAPRMSTLRMAMSFPIDKVPLDDARRIEFNNLHVYSVNTLLLAMIAALVVIVLIGTRLKLKTEG